MSLFTYTAGTVAFNVGGFLDLVLRFVLGAIAAALVVLIFWFGLMVIMRLVKMGALYLKVYRGWPF